jgi:hypothetical protein|tara:strand:- start:531 stop:845 length:315 start_codon:yes stop_codon:yes gene_type:complete
MKNELKVKNKYLDKSIIELATDMIEKDKLDKHILMQIIGVRNELNLHRSLYGHLYTSYTYECMYKSNKLAILERIVINIRESKMSKIEKEYLLILLKKALQYPR